MEWPQKRAISLSETLAPGNIVVNYADPVKPQMLFSAMYKIDAECTTDPPSRRMAARSRVMLPVISFVVWAHAAGFCAAGESIKFMCPAKRGVWRSPVARLLWEQEVPGSNPGAPILYRFAVWSASPGGTFTRPAGLVRKGPR